MNEKGQKAAEHNLFNNFSFFGITELFKESISAMSRIFFLPQTRVVHNNMTRTPDITNYSLDYVREVIRDIDHLDIKLYNKAKQVFVERFL